MKRVRSKIVGYYRTSTVDQRLGMDAQIATLKRISEERGCEIVRTFLEHESGGDNARVELDKALRHARRINALLVVAKLDRLARDSTFLMKLYDGDVPIVFGDLPEVDGSAASRFMVQMMANVAEFERRRISERTREALRALKAQGRTLGTPANLTDEARLRGSKSAAVKRIARAIEDQSDIAEVALKLRAEGSSLRQIANHLNAEGYVSRRGCEWEDTLVRRVIRRVGGR
jgi:DNA invertase Pin-like site-specific DNA recombinase